MRALRLAVLAAATLWLGGCDMLGLESASQVAARREAEGRAIGGACRHAARSIEACYEQNRRADKAAIFAGWREMNDYMRENKLEAMPAPESTSVAAAEAAREDAQGAGHGAAEAAGAALHAVRDGAKDDRKAERRDEPKATKAPPPRGAVPTTP